MNKIIVLFFGTILLISGIYAFSPMLNPQGERDARLVVDVTYFANYDPPNASLITDMSGNIFVGTEDIWRGSGYAIIELTENGVPIIDSSPQNLSYYDVPGLHVIRGVENGRQYVDFVTYGFNHRESRESLKFNIEFWDSTIIGFAQDGKGIGSYEKHDRRGCGIIENSERNAINDRPGNDEITQIDRNKMEFCTITNARLDGVRVYHKSSSLG